MNRNHADNWRSSEKLFRSAIEDYNQTIKCCGVGSYHQNDAVEMNIETSIITARTLLLHKKIYCLESMTIILWTYALKAFAEKLNKIKVDGDGVTHMMNFQAQQQTLL